MIDPGKLKELEALALQEFKRHYTAIGANGGDEISITRKGEANERYEIAISAPVSPILAMTHRHLEKIAMHLGLREMFLRMLEYFKYENFPTMNNLLNGAQMDFHGVWQGCKEDAKARFGEDSWKKMTAEIMAKPSSNVFSTWTTLVFDPEKPEASQVAITTAFSVDSKYLLPEERHGCDLLDFASWARKIAEKNS